MEDIGKSNKLHQVLCGILGTLVIGCDQVPDPNALIPTQDWQGVQCNNGNMDLLTELQLDESVDSLSLLELSNGSLGPRLISAGGVECNTATDREACQSTLNSIPQTVFTQALVITQGDEVRIFDSEDKAQDFLGQLDNAQKVFGWMHVHGMHLSCIFDDSAVIEGSDGQTWKGVYTEYTQTCAPVVKERVRVEINVNDWSIIETARAVIERDNNTCIGRKPPGALSITSRPERSEYYDSLGKKLARHAAYEAASVVAFEHLFRELQVLGAPASILTRVIRAADDECRHALQVALLAKRYGHRPDTFEVQTHELRDMETIAIDNMKEGCIGETWGALIGLYQARKAQDEVIAETMQQVATDEVEHASLSWEIHNWLYERLDENARQRVDTAKHVALNRLIQNAENTVDPSHVKYAGLPEAMVARQLAEHLVQSLAV